MIRPEKERELQEALVEVLVHGELEPALELTAEICGGIEAAFFRFPRASCGDLGKDMLALSAMPAPVPTRIVLMLDEAPFAQRGAAGIVMRGETAFTPDQIADAKTCCAQIAAAHRRIRRFEALMGQNSGLMALIEKRLGACATLATASGEILWMSQSAREVLGPKAKELLQEQLRTALREAVADPETAAKEFVLKGEGTSKVFGAMSFVRETPGASVHYVAVELHGSEVDSHADEYKLTKSEREVYKMLMQGSSNEDIAKTRFVSIETVRTHVKNLFRKLGVSSRLELVTRQSKRAGE